LVCRYVFRIFR